MHIPIGYYPGQILCTDLKEDCVILLKNRIAMLRTVCPPVFHAIALNIIAADEMHLYHT